MVLCAIAAEQGFGRQDSAGAVYGTVRDGETGLLLEGANVVVRETPLGAATSRDGSFRIENLQPGAYTIVASMIGYEPVSTAVVIPLPDGRPLEILLTPKAIETEQIVVTASRREQRAREVPVSLAVISAVSLVERNIVTMDDALRYVPGVNLLEDQVNIRGSSGYSRGVGSRVLLLLDGLPFITGDTGEINWETIPAGDVERVEVIKGAGSALYGSSALGGVINVITRAMPDEPILRFTAFSGLYDNPRYEEWKWSDSPRFHSGLTVGYADRSGPIGYLLSATRTVDESYLENDALHRWSFFGKAQYDLSAGQSLSAVFNMLTRKHGNFFWWKSLREATIPADIQRNGSVSSTRGNVSLGYKETVSEDLFYVVKGMYFGNFWRDDSAGHVNNVSASHVLQTDIQITSVISGANILTFGVAGNFDQVHSNLFGDHRGFGFAAYVQDEIKLTDEMNFNAGARYDFQKASVLSGAGRLSPKVGMTVSLSRETVLRASLGAGFRYPSIGELFISSSTNVSQLVILPNVNLRPETSATGEIGVAARIAETIDVDASVFWNEFNDLIEPSVKIKNIRATPSDTVGTDRAVVEFDNVTKARIQGAEIGLKTSWWARKGSTELGYTLLWPEDIGEKVVLKFRPRHIFYATASVSWENLKIGTDYRFISRIDRIDDQLVQLAPIIHGDVRVPIHTVDVRASAALLPLGLPLRVGINVTNVLNYHYVELIGNLAEPRTFTFVLEGAF
ncbi:MAG TPA: TonB-dependent receptor [Bacteroidota bacterium]